MNQTPLSWWIGKESKKITAICKQVAIKYHLDPDDINSSVNHSLSKALVKNSFELQKDVNEKTKFYGYIWRIANNNAINMYRRNRKANIVDQDSEITFKMADTLDHNQVEQPDFEGKQFAKRVEKGLRNYFNKVNDGGRYLRLFDYFFVEGRKYEEMAELEGVPCGTIKTRIHIIRKVASKLFNKEYQDYILN